MGEWVFPPDGGRMEKAEGLYLQTMNMTQIRDRLKTNDLIIIPVGSTECHGAGQPLGEDTFLVDAHGGTSRLENRPHHCGTGLVWIPSLQSPGHARHNCSAGRRILANLRAIIAGLWNMGFRKQIFLNGHGQEEVIPLALGNSERNTRCPRS